MRYFNGMAQRKGIKVYVCFLYSSYSLKKDIRCCSSYLHIREKYNATHVIRSHIIIHVVMKEKIVLIGLSRRISRPTRK